MAHGSDERADAARLAELQRIVFSPTPPPGVDLEASTAELARLTARVPDASAPAAPPPQAAASSAPAPSTPVPPTRTPRLVVIASALVLAAALGWLAGRWTGPVAETSGSATSETPRVPPAALGIFDREAVAADVPPVPLRDTFLPESTRLLVPGLVEAGSAFAARDRSGRVCVIVIGPLDRPSYASTCSFEGEFPASGLRVSMEVPRDAASVTDLVAVWYPDGTSESAAFTRGL